MTDWRLLIFHTICHAHKNIYLPILRAYAQGYWALYKARDTCLERIIAQISKHRSSCCRIHQGGWKWTLAYMSDSQSLFLRTCLGKKRNFPSTGRSTRSTSARVQGWIDQNSSTKKLPSWSGSCSTGSRESALVNISYLKAYKIHQTSHLAPSNKTLKNKRKQRRNNGIILNRLREFNLMCVWGGRSFLNMSVSFVLVANA